MASQQNDPLTFKSWGENCTSFWELLANGSITQDQFLGSCKPQVDIGVGKVILTILLSILLLGTAGGNILVIIAILIVKKLRSPTNLLIVSLAVTDFMVSILVLPFAIVYQIFEYWPFQQAICDLYSISDVLLCTLSILSLCTISIDRYMAITKPFQYAPKRTPKRMFIMILISWLLSAAISISPIFGWEQQNAPFFCNYNMDLTFQIYATLTAFYIPLTVMLVLYGKILVLAKQMAIADAQIARKSSTNNQTRNSSFPDSTDWNRSSICPPENNCANLQFFNDLKDNWDGAERDVKSRQSVVSFRPSPVVMRTNRDPVKSRKVNSMMAFTRRSQSDVVDNGRSSEYSGSVADRSTSSYAKSPITLLRRGKGRSPSDQGKGETHKAVTTLGVIMGCFTVCWLPFFVSQLITPIINIFSKQKFFVNRTLFQVFLWLGYGNSFLNPLIYALFNREFRMPFLYILRFQCSDINTRLRTENFSHQFGLPRKSGTSYTNSISSISSGKRRPRQKSRGLIHCNVNSPSIASTIEAPNVQIESSPAKSLTKEESKSNEEEFDYQLTPALNNALNQPLSTPQHFFPVSITTEDDDLLENNPPRPSRLMSRRESLASTRSYYDSYIPNLSVEYSRSPQPTSTSDPTNLRTWTKARDYKPTQIPPERFRRCSGMLNGVKNDFSTEQISLL